MATQTDYKTGELGMIPQDWDVVELGKVCDIDTENLTSNTDSDYEFDYISLEQIDNGHLLNTEKYKFKDAPSRARRVVRKNDVLISTVRPNLMSHYYVKNEVRDLICSTGFSVVRGTNKLNMPYLYHHLFANIINSQINLVVVGSNYPAINSHDIKNLKIPLPSTPEQTAIATALSDTDALISSLQTLIAKKKAIKLSAMQNLLSGKIRLPEFAQRPDGSPKTTHQTELGLLPEDWEVGTIGKDCVLKARIGWQSLRTDEYLESGEYGLITGTDLNNGLVDWKTCAFVSEWRYKQDTNIQLKVNDVLITKDGTIGKIGYINELPFSATLNSGIYVVRPKNSNLIESMFLFFLFSSEYFNDFISVISAGSTITHLYQKDFFNFQFPLPSKPEQTAIAQLLSDMDAEIEALECRLKKTQSLKQGMMQALLSGKIRLPLK